MQLDLDQVIVQVKRIQVFQGLRARVWGATTGLWLAIAKIQRGCLKKTDLIPGLFVATMLHFLWNGWSGFLGPGLGEIAMFLQLGFYFWYMRKIIKEALRDEVLWGYGAGLAPNE